MIENDDDDNKNPPETKEEQYEVEVIPDVTETKKPVAKTETDDDDEDYGDYSAKVKHRIGKEVAKRRGAERERDADRLRLTQLEQQLRQAGTRIDKGDQQTVDAEERRIAAEISKAQRDFREAREKGDVDGESSALASIAEAKADKKALDLYKQDRRLPGKDQPQQEEQRQAAPKLHPLAEEWKEENESWFEKHSPTGRRMTSMAYAIDQELAEEGFDLNSPDYYAELTKRVQKQFPEFFKKPAVRSQPVAEVTRSEQPKKTRLEVSESEAKVARSLGVTLADYARNRRVNE